MIAVAERPKRKCGRPRNPGNGWIEWKSNSTTRATQRYVLRTRVSIQVPVNGEITTVRRKRALGYYPDYDAAYAALVRWRRSQMVLPPVYGQRY